MLEIALLRPTLELLLVSIVLALFSQAAGWPAQLHILGPLAQPPPPPKRPSLRWCARKTALNLERRPSSHECPPGTNQRRAAPSCYSAAAAMLVNGMMSPPLSSAGGRTARPKLGREGRDLKRLRAAAPSDSLEML